MSWIDRIKNDMVITCGDGVSFRPLWKKATKVKEYNTSQFDFNNVSGSLIVRKNPKGAKYLLEIYFQGDLNIEDADLFEISADDNRPWTISHPLYNRIVVQPLSLNRDNTKNNVTKFSISVVETITDENPKTTESPKESIERTTLETVESIGADYAVSTIPNVSDIDVMKRSIKSVTDQGSKIASNTEDAQKYKNLLNKANAAVLNATKYPLEAMNAIQSVINAPAIFAVSVKSRIDTFEKQLSKLAISIPNILTPSSKRYYESASGGLLSGMSLAMVTNTDYSNRNEVIEAVDKLNLAYDDYVANLELLQTDSYNSPDSYIPSYDSQSKLNDLVNYTISNLFRITINSRQERSIILENDSNVIELAHRFYGLEPDDSTIDEIVETNGIGINELLGVKKGRTIVYFI